MNKINEFIKTLSENDKKTLTGKTLKATEELGELAKAVLPYENAPGTLHRFVHRRQILENAVDLMLCAMSIAYDLKYSDEEIESMMHEKATKWAGLQAKEGRVNFPLPYEIHVTVDALMDERSIQIFKDTCQEINVKPIIIDLEVDGKVIMKDAMTSSVHYGDNNTAIKEANQIAKHFKINGYDVLRVKIETVPWHPAAPSKGYFINNNEMPKNSYFESHLRIITTEGERKILEMIASRNGAHLSRNFFKKLNNEQYVIMMTLRSYRDTSEEFKKKVDELQKILKEANFVVDKTEIEFAVYDSKMDHDLEWIRG